MATPTPFVDLIVGKVPDTDSVDVGQLIVFTVSYANMGNRQTTGVVLTEVVPEFTTFTATASSPGWSCPDGSPFGTVCEQNVGTLLPGEVAELLYAVTVISDPPTGRVVNLVRISDSDGNEDEDVVEVGGKPPAPAPALGAIGLFVSILLLAGIGLLHLGRRRAAHR